MAAHSSTIAWKIPWLEEPGGLQSMGSQRVGQDKNLIGNRELLLLSLLFSIGNSATNFLLIIKAVNAYCKNVEYKKYE